MSNSSCTYKGYKIPDKIKIFSTTTVFSFQESFRRKIQNKTSKTIVAKQPEGISLREKKCDH